MRDNTRHCQDNMMKDGIHNLGYITSSNASLYTGNLDGKTQNLSYSPKPRHVSEEESLQIFKDARADLEKVPEDWRRKWLIDRFTQHYSEVMPPSIIELTAAYYFPGDSGIGLDVRPEWLEIEKFRRGQKLARDNLFGVFYSDLISLFTVFALQDGLETLILTGASSTPYTAFKRYLSTLSRVISWYTSDPWTPGSPAYNDIRAVRRMHALARKKIPKMSKEEYDEKMKVATTCCPALNRTRLDFESTCPVPKPGQCPFTGAVNFTELEEHKVNQSQMACTQFAFVGLFVLQPKFFGSHDTTDEDIEAFCHLWRGLGYLLGIDDDFNFCRGSLEDVRTRSRDFLEYWVKPHFRVAKPEWEHMMRCVLEGMQYYFPGLTYKICLLDLAEVMNMQMPHTHNSLSKFSKIKHNILRFYFKQGSKLPCLRIFANWYSNVAVKRACNFKEHKHEQLKKRSAKTIDLYVSKVKKNEVLAV